MEEINPSQTRGGKSLEDRVDSSTERIEIPDSVTKIDYDAFRFCTSLKDIIIKNLSSVQIDTYTTFSNCDSLNSEFKEKMFYKFAKDITAYHASNLLKSYNIKYNSELIQELMTINVVFFEIANDIDKEVFLDEALNNIKLIYKEDYGQVIATNLCNILIIGSEYYLYSSDNDSNTIEIKNYDFIEKINNGIKNYKEKEDLDR